MPVGPSFTRTPQPTGVRGSTRSRTSRSWQRRVRQTRTDAFHLRIEKGGPTPSPGSGRVTEILLPSAPDVTESLRSGLVVSIPESVTVASTGKSPGPVRSGRTSQTCVSRQLTRLERLNLLRSQSSLNLGESGKGGGEGTGTLHLLLIHQNLEIH